MDRLIIETTLADTKEIYLSDGHGSDHRNAIVLSFRSEAADQVAHAFETLITLSQANKITLQVCKTLSAGIYDLELKTAGLDEPVRIMNKSLSPDILTAIKDDFAGKPMVLGASVLTEKAWLALSSVEIKDCAL